MTNEGSKHKHKAPMIERVLPIEHIIQLFRHSFDQPYLNPSAELTLQEFKAAFPEISEETILSVLSYWTNHSGKRLLQKKVVRIDGEDSEVWFVHGLDEHGMASMDETTSPLTHKQ